MKKTLLEFLRCPACKKPLDLSVFAESSKPGFHPEILEGILRCAACRELYPVVAGIPRFVPNVMALFPDFAKKYARNIDAAKGEKVAGLYDQAVFEKVHGDTQERFGYEWMNYPGSLPEDREIFLAETQIPESEWKGKWILDGGCGMGRYSRVAHSFGANVIAMDLSRALVRLWDLAETSERMHLIQGNLMSPPLKENCLDTVYSIGVIHHTPSAQQTFGVLARLVKPGGHLSVWVYGAPGKFENFKTNPLRPDRQGLKKIIFWVWSIVVIREFLSDTLRLFTVHMPHRLLYALCYPLAWLGKIPLVKYLTFSVHPLWRVRLQENFDWLTPPYQSHHTKEELTGWFEAAGFEPLKVLPHGFVPKPGVLGRKK